MYSQTCTVSSEAYYNSVSKAAYAYIMAFYKFSESNSALLDDEIIPEFKSIKSSYENDYVVNMTTYLTSAYNDVIEPIYSFFSAYISSTPLDHPDETDEEINVLSYLNYSSIGRDFNITLSVMKKKFKDSSFNIFIFNIISNFLTITCMIFLTFLTIYYRNKKKFFKEEKDISDGDENEDKENDDLTDESKSDDEKKEKKEKDSDKDKEVNISEIDNPKIYENENEKITNAMDTDKFGLKSSLKRRDGSNSTNNNLLNLNKKSVDFAEGV